MRGLASSQPTDEFMTVWTIRKLESGALEAGTLRDSLESWSFPLSL